ncbi:MAG: extracellular solute-binding protein, partial [Chloroflexota bacterium]|nr:extracellular solute-binding protein [Chloroflexota bacterium]
MAVASGRGRAGTAARWAAIGLAALTVLQVAFTVWVGRPAGAAEEDVTSLIVWDGFVGAEAEAARRVYDAFLAEHPDLAIERRVLEGEAAEPEAVATALASGVGPDVLAYDVGPGFREKLTQEQLLVPLNELPVRYGWTERLDGVARRWASRGGRLYALPVEQRFLALYANRALLDGAWLRAPRTATELLEFCRQARAKGLVPFAVGADPGAELGNLYAMALNTWLGPGLTEKLLFTDWATWDTTRVAWALRLVAVEMPQAGCYDVGPAAPADGRAFFAEQQALLWPGSSAAAGEL